MSILNRILSRFNLIVVRKNTFELRALELKNSKKFEAFHYAQYDKLVEYVGENMGREAERKVRSEYIDAYNELPK